MDLRQMQTERIERMRESHREEVLETTGFDVAEIDWYAHDFSARNLREACYRLRGASMGRNRMREASAA